jgi:hypothetical protein
LESHRIEDLLARGRFGSFECLTGSRGRHSHYGAKVDFTPPPPALAPQVIEVVEDEEEIEETVIESTETDQEEVIVDVEEIDVEEEEEEVIVPFAIIEDIPIFPGCEKVSKKNKGTVFTNKSTNIF